MTIDPRRIHTHTLAEVPRTHVYLWVSKDQVIEADLFDSLYKESKGKIAPELHITCPRCNGDIRVDGHSYEIEIEYLDKPRRLVLPDGGIAHQHVVISVEGVRRCPHDDQTGKGICGYTFVIRRNKVHRS